MKMMLLSVRSHGLVPYLCMGGGLLALLVVGTAFAYPIGLVLIAAGMLDWTRRFRSQRKAEASRSVPATNPPRPDGPDPGNNLMMIRWDSSFECGHPVIDMQHRELFNISNVLINSVMERKPKLGIEYLLHKLVEHIKDHFSSEEEVLVRTRYPLVEEHRAIHRGLLERAVELEDRYRAGLLPTSDLVGFVAYDVIAAHVIQDDMKFRLLNRKRNIAVLPIPGTPI
jgi:hemerythrin-like metal-binding protein